MDDLPDLGTLADLDELDGLRRTNAERVQRVWPQAIGRGMALPDLGVVYMMTMLEHLLGPTALKQAQETHERKVSEILDSAEAALKSAPLLVPSASNGIHPNREQRRHGSPDAPR